MTPLMIAIGIYILGMATILYIRPHVMFYTETGAWKEFGLDSGRTVLPLWMFAIIWAIVSYVAATLVSIYLSGLAIQSLPVNVVETNIANIIKPVSQLQPPTVPVVAPAPVTTPPGYYVLESPVVGQPKYIYYGANPPS